MNTTTRTTRTRTGTQRLLRVWTLVLLVLAPGPLGMLGPAAAEPRVQQPPPTRDLNWRLHYASGRVFDADNPNSPFPVGTWRKVTYLGRFGGLTLVELIGGSGEHLLLRINQPLVSREATAYAWAKMEVFPNSRWEPLAELVLVEVFTNGDLRIALRVALRGGGQ